MIKQTKRKYRKILKSKTKKRRNYNKKGGKHLTKKNTKSNKNQQIKNHLNYVNKSLIEQVNETAINIIKKLLELHNDMKKLKNKSGEEYNEKKIHMNVLIHEILYVFKIYKKYIFETDIKILEGGSGNQGLDELNSLFNRLGLGDRENRQQPQSEVVPYQRSQEYLQTIQFQGQQLAELRRRINDIQNELGKPKKSESVKWGSFHSILLLLAVIVSGITVFSLGPVGQGISNTLHTTSRTINKGTDLLNNSLRGVGESVNEAGSILQGFTSVQGQQIRTQQLNARLEKGKTKTEEEKTRKIEQETKKLVAEEKLKEEEHRKQHLQLVLDGDSIINARDYYQRLELHYECVGDDVCLYQALLRDPSISATTQGQGVLKTVTQHLKSFWKENWEYMDNMWRSQAHSKSIHQQIENGHLPKQAESLALAFTGEALVTAEQLWLRIDDSMDGRLGSFGNWTTHGMMIEPPGSNNSTSRLELPYNLSNSVNLQDNSAAILPQMGSQTSVNGLPSLIPRQSTNNNNNNNNSPYT